MTEKKETRGGKRPGAGRNASEAGPLVRVTYRVTKEQKDKAARLGGAAWLRATLDATAES